MDLTMTQSVNSIFLLSGSLFCLIAALSFWWGKNFEKRTRRWMICMQLSASLLLCSDAAAYIFRGRPDRIGYWAVRISNFLVFFALDVTLLFFVRYVNSCLFRQEECRRIKRSRIATVSCFLGMTLVVVSQFTGLYYTFDADNLYHRAAGYPISMLIPVITMLLEASLLLQYRKRISNNLFLATGSYIVLPLVGAAIQFRYYGPSFINLMIGVSMILMFLVSISEQNREVHRLEASRAQIAEKLEIATMLNRCVTQLSSGADMDTALHNLMEVVRDYFGADRSYLFEILPGKNVLVNTYEAVGQGVVPQIDNLQEVPLEVVGHWMEAFRRDKVYYMEDLEQEKGYESYQMLVEQNVQRLLAVPMCRDNQIIGFLGLDNPRNHAQDPTLLSSIRYFITNSLEQRDRQEYLKQIGYHDMLTHLRNRNGYMEDMELWKEAAPASFGALYMDLNSLKKANDNYGHEAGDALICRMAAVLELVFPRQAYRIGGDEFIVALPGIPQDAFNDGVERLRTELQRQGVSAAVGAVWADHPADLEDLMREADSRMYQEKEKMKQQ